jgi:hypothetical protein
MWRGLRNRKHNKDGEMISYEDNDDNDDNDDNELAPMIPKYSGSEFSYRSVPVIPTVSIHIPSVTKYGNTIYNDGVEAYVQNHSQNHTTTDKLDGIDIDEININLSNMGEYIKITPDIYAGTCLNIPTDLLKSIGFNKIINIDSTELLLDINDYEHVCITEDNLRNRSTHKIVHDHITKGLLNPKILINFSDLNTMIVVVSFYLLKNRIDGTTFMDIYELGALPMKYIGIVNELIPNIHQFNKENDLTRLHNMFPDTDVSKLEKLYKDHYGILEDIIHHMFI